MDCENIEDKLKKSSFETFQFEGSLDICSLPENRILSSKNGALTIYDENFNAIKKVDRIDDKKIDCYGILVNKLNVIYATDYKNNCIYMLDLELNKIKSVGSKGIDKAKFDGPIGIACKDELIYISDCANRRIQIMNLDLVYVGAIILNFSPQTIKIINSTLGVLGYDKSVSFYDLKTKKLRKQYSGFLGRICSIGTKFYVISLKPILKTYCFDSDGNLLNEISMEKFQEYFSNLSGWDGNMLYFNDTLYITIYTNKQVIKF